MERIIYITGKIFNGIFAPYGSQSYSLFERILNGIILRPYLIVGISLVIIGFSVSVIKRLIHS